MALIGKGEVSGKNFVSYICKINVFFFILELSPDKAIDGIAPTDVYAINCYYHSNTKDPTSSQTMGWGWLQVDFMFTWNIVSLDIRTRNGGPYNTVWKRQNNLEVSGFI